MTTSEALILIYKFMAKYEGRVAAREHISIILSNAICDLELDELPITAENLEVKLVEKAESYKEDSDEKTA
jgi:hypothetical protein